MYMLAVDVLQLWVRVCCLWRELMGPKQTCTLRISCGFWHDFRHTLLLLLPPAKKKEKKRHANSWKLSPHQWSSLMSLIHAPLEKWFYNSVDFWIFYKMWSVCCCLGYDACTPNKQQVSVYGQSSPTVYDRFVHKPCTAEGDKIKTCFLGHV